MGEAWMTLCCCGHLAQPEGGSRRSADALDVFERRAETRSWDGVCWVVVEVEGTEKGGSKAGGGVWLKHDDTRIELSFA